MNNRDIAYYGLTETFNNLFSSGKEGQEFRHLMRLVDKQSNIMLAIKTISSNPGRNTSGLDKLTFDELMKSNHELIFKEIRQRIRHKSASCVKRVYIPKANGKRRPLGIGSIVDRIVQQCFLNILIPITESQFSPNSFGFRLNCTTKHAFAKVANWLWKSNRNLCVIDIDFQSFFDNVPLEVCLDNLRIYFHIKDSEFIRNLKRILYTSTYDNGIVTPCNGIGLPQGSILGPTLANVMLHTLDLRLDRCITELPDSRTKGMWKSIDQGRWDILRDGVPYLRYVRYADDIRIVTSSESQVDDIITIIEHWCEEFSIPLNFEKSNWYDTSDFPEISMVGFRARKGQDGLIISPTDPRQVCKQLKHHARLAIQTHNPSKFVATFISLCSQYDCCTSLRWMIQYTESILNSTKRSDRKIVNSLLYTKDNARYYSLPVAGKEDPLLFSPWVIRKESSTSVSNYLRSCFVQNFDNITVRSDCYDYIQPLTTNDYNGRCVMYVPGLLHRQNFKCYVTGELLSPSSFEIHHKKPLHKGGSDTFSNLVLISTSVHKALHSKTLRTKFDTYPNFQKLLKEL